ncbi:MAG TPA: hypothetical protein VN787_07285 [Steroidobacteraceae bacterium]|nr:hypothetical protein [Steroidobacteraceae bacterium]
MSVLQPNKCVSPRAITAREPRFVMLADSKLRAARRPAETRRGLESVYRNNVAPTHRNLCQSRIIAPVGALR